jgi:tetratricopeptide (TPR) repeat protein
MVISRRARTIFLVAAALLLMLSLAAVGANWWAARHFDEANRLVEGQQFAEAYLHYVECLKVWRWSDSAQLLAGRTARRALLYPEAEVHFDKCLSLRGRDRTKTGDVALERVLMQAQQGEFRDIEEILWQKVKQNVPETPLILEALARGYLRMFRLSAALRCLKIILERDPDNVEALVNRGWVLEMTSGALDAMKDYRRALELRPDRDDVRLSLAVLLVKHDPEEARQELERLIQRKPDNPRVLLGLANVYQAIPEFEDKASSLIEAVLAKDPDNAQALMEKGLIAIASGKLLVEKVLLAEGRAKIAEGEALLKKAIEKDQVDLDAHYKLYLFLCNQPGREAEAQAQRECHRRVEADVKRLGEIIGHDMSKMPYDPNLHYEIGTIYLRYGKYDLARRWLESARKLDPGHQPTLRALSSFLKRQAGAGPQAEDARERSETTTSASALPK